MTKKRTISTKNAPAAIGPYSQAVLIGNTLFLSGQIPIDPQTGNIECGEIEKQARRVFNNIGEVLAAAGASFHDVVKTTVFLTDLSDFAAVNAVYAEFFAEPYPARSCVQVAALPKGAKIETEVIAIIPQA